MSVKVEEGRELMRMHVLSVSRPRVGVKREGVAFRVRLLGNSVGESPVGATARLVLTWVIAEQGQIL
jgi:hypothetical protein